MRLALFPLNPIVGDVQGNAALIAAALDRARAQRADLAVFPELALTGYPPRDLLAQEGFVAACLDQARRIGLRHTGGLTAVFGLPMPHDESRPDGALANALAVYRDNRFIDSYFKRLLPTYDVFDEDRYFEPGGRACVVDVPAASGAAVRVGLAVCEDLWKGHDAGFASRYTDAPDPVADLVRAGARVVVAPSASPFVLGKASRHRQILRDHAAGHHLFVASLNQRGGNDELVFDGHTLVYNPEGSLIAAGPCFDPEPLVVDLPDADAPGASRPGLRVSVPDRFIELPPEEQLYRALVTGVRDYLGKTGFRSAILGLSGGIDSAVTAAIAAAALGPANVLGVALPGKYSSAHALEDARESARRLDMPFRVVPIEGPFEGFRAALDADFLAAGLPALGRNLPDLTEENLQSRIRGTTLMALSNRTGSILLTTGNKSELAVGYCTLYGDMNGGLAVLSDVSKQWVYRLARWMNERPRDAGFQRPPVPERSITKAPSAELRPNQTDQDSLPPYEQLDAIIERAVELRQSAARIIRETGFDEGTVRRVLRLIDLSEFKRKQAAIGLKVTSVAFGSGRRHPIAQGWNP